MRHRSNSESFPYRSVNDRRDSGYDAIWPPEKPRDERNVALMQRSLSAPITEGSTYTTAARILAVPSFLPVTEKQPVESASLSIPSMTSSLPSPGIPAYKRSITRDIPPPTMTAMPNESALAGLMSLSHLLARSVNERSARMSAISPRKLSSTARLVSLGDSSVPQLP